MCSRRQDGCSVRGTPDTLGFIELEVMPTCFVKMSDKGRMFPTVQTIVETNPFAESGAGAPGTSC